MRLGAWLRHWVDPQFRPSRHSRAARPDRACQRRSRPSVLAFEVLEDRTVPSFAAPVGYDAGPGPAAVTAGQFRGSSAPLDLVVPNFVPVGTISVLLGNGDGTFQQAVAYPTGSNGPTAAVVGDFNNDGHLDLAVLNFNNADGVISILLGNGDGTFQPPITTHVGQGAAALAVGDFDGDGNLDVVTANGSNNTVSLLLGNGDGTFTLKGSVPVGAYPQSIAVGDFNNDGNLDVVTGNANASSVSVLLGNGDGSFRPAATYAAGFVPGAVAVGDLRGIGTQDLVVTNQSGTVSVLLGNGDGSFQPLVQYAAGRTLKAEALADVNGDGKLDIVVPDYLNNTVNVLFGHGDGTFQAPQPYAGGSGPHGIVAGDFNGDGFPDLAVLNDGVLDLAVLINNADWSAPPGAPAAPSGSAPAVSGAVPSDAEPLSFSWLSPAGTAQLTIPHSGPWNGLAQDSQVASAQPSSLAALDEVFSNLGGSLPSDPL